MYKSLIKKNKRQFEQHIWQKLEHFEKRNPGEYWNLFNALKHLDNVHRKNDIPASEWTNTFQTF